MLKLNKLEKQTIRPAAEVYDVCAQLCSVAVQFEDAWERKDIEFDADLEDAAYTQADPGLLELVWTNLLSNAVKFTPQGGSITLRQTRANGKIYVSVTDTGCGMDEKTIFRRYVLKNSILPTITVFGINLAYTVMGAALIEVVFAWPGIGRMMLDAIGKRDYPLLMGIYLVLSISVAVITMLTDLVYAAVDPRIRYK